MSTLSYTHHDVRSEDDAVGCATAEVAIFPVHFARTFSMQRLGGFDPTARLDADCFRKAFFYRGEPAAVMICRTNCGARGLRVTAYANHADELLAETIAGLTQDDRYADFATDDTGMLRLHRLFPGLRLLRMPWLYDVTCAAILQQRVRYVDAVRGWGRMVRRWGTSAPLGLRAFPAADVLAQVPRFALEAMDIDAKRARALLTFARESRLVAMRAEMSFADLRRYLLRVPGIGPWTAETVLAYGAGDVDAAIPGDLHLPRVVCYALAGEERGSDERMMELLEPFRGDRFRIIRLIGAAGVDVPW